MKLKMIKIYLCVVSAFLLFPLSAYSFDGPLVRVAVLKDVNDFEIKIRNSYKIIAGKDDTSLSSRRRLKKVKVYSYDEGMKIGGTYYPFKNLKIELKRDIYIYSKGKKRSYRGEVHIIKKEKGFLVVNIVDIEKYIKGVLYHEVSHKWPIDAIKAQAVAARTYAIYQMKVNKDNDYDVTSDIYSQVYGGKGSERFRTNIAVNRTKSLVMMFKGDILPAYFHSNSGGRTEDVKELWNHDLAPLRGVVDKFSMHQPGFNWRQNVRLRDIQDKLNKRKDINLSLIEKISVLDRNKSGRIINLLIKDNLENEVKISGKDFRNIVGPNLIKSNFYDVFMKGYYVDFIGKGWGHGVGMSQWGAYNMAKKDMITKRY